MESMKCIANLFLVFLCSLIPDVTNVDLPPEHDGHLKRFGAGGPSHPIDEVYGFPDQKSFFQNYALCSKPLKMTGAARMSPAFHLWSDDYFLSLDITKDDDEITVEIKKKENRKENVISMHFHDFINVYNNSEYYMVSSVPSFLGPDVLVPCSLQCPDVLEKNLVAAMMWISSGGTKSVVHTDAVDNINCVYRGEKEFVFVDPKYNEKVDMDHPEGSYCGVDVDSVDYTKYPGLAEVEFYHVNLSAGDCLFIPYKWIHQVRSYNSNIAVNLWWDHYNSKSVDIDACNTVCDNTLTVDKVEFHGFQTLLNSIEIIRDHFQSILASFKTITLELLFEVHEVHFSENEKSLEEKFNHYIKELFSTLDLNDDGVFTMEELNQMPDTGSGKSWKTVQTYMFEIEDIEDTLDAENGEMKSEDSLDAENDGMESEDSLDAENGGMESEVPGTEQLDEDHPKDEL